MTSAELIYVQKRRRIFDVEDLTRLKASDEQLTDKNA